MWSAWGRLIYDAVQSADGFHWTWKDCLVIHEQFGERQSLHLTEPLILTTEEATSIWVSFSVGKRWVHACGGCRGRHYCRENAGFWGSEATNNAWPLPNLEEPSHLCSQDIVGMLMKEMTVKLSDLWQWWWVTNVWYSIVSPQQAVSTTCLSPISWRTWRQVRISCSPRTFILPQS